ncbi:MAG TPA: N-acetylglucosamine-6-phosphate deacetylase [Firmicutes bacterium]|nr:N-acetylglucosamine-6-phosphate deacetylase [Bacillota bacterium]
MNRLVTNCRIITPGRILDDHCLEITGKVISRILSPGEAVAKDYDEVLDCMGAYVAPGFIDLHNHGNSGFDVMDATLEALAEMAAFHLRNGVTGFLGTTMSKPTAEVRKAIMNMAVYAENQNQRIGGEPRSELLGIYLEGPYLSPKRKGAQAEEYLKAPDLQELQDFLTVTRGYLKVVALAPERIGAPEAIAYLKSQGIVVAAGHTDATYEQTVAAVEAGVTDAVHLFNGMRGFGHREPGPPGALLLDQRVICELICDGIHLHPAAVEMAVRLKGTAGIILISDAMRATGLGDGCFDLGGQQVIVSGGIARLRNGDLAGSTLTLDRAIYNMMRMAKIPLHEAVQMATLNPARLIGVAERKGSIEPGKDADLVVCDAEIRIKHVIKAGRIVFSASAQE